MSRIEKKINRAIRLIQSIDLNLSNGFVEVAYSGGKDSDVILNLTKESGIPYKAIYKNTTIDPPQTIKHAMDVGAEILRPEKTFFQLIEKKGFPSRFVRFCCSELKEYSCGNYNVIMGIRREESAKRAERYKEPTLCRVYRGGGRGITSYCLF